MSTLESHTSFHMNCSWSISYFPQTNLTKSFAKKLVSDAFSKISAFENYFTTFKDSPFNNLNKYAGKQEVLLNQEAILLLKKSIEYYQTTNKNFNICFQSKSFKSDPREIIIDESRSAVLLPHKDMKVSLGGIGKGYAVDMAFNHLKKNGMINFMVNGSGDLRVHSHINSPRPWRVGITNPFNTKNNIGVINIKQGAIATSGQYLKKNHIKTAYKDTPLAVTVLSDQTTHSDVMATYLSSLNIKESLNLMEQLNLNGTLIDRRGNVLRSSSSFKRDIK